MNFQDSLKLILQFEGGFVDDASDRGGRTNYGVTQKVYSAWLLSQNLKDADVKNITPDEVATIYQNQYWNSSPAKLAKDSLNTVIFDCAVNSGVGRATKTLQNALSVVADGSFGQKSIDALNACDSVATANKFLDTRASFYKAICINSPSQQKFLNGWLNRVNILRKVVDAG